ncbi:MAG: HNH endonuclease [Terriglobales bacterium]
MKCIYCNTEDPSMFTSAEHVFPQSFGTFGSHTPTLKACVCDNCNQYFKKELDQLLARESLEGLTRYKKGILSSERRVQRRLIIKLPETPEMGAAGSVLVWIDGTTGQIGAPLPQVHFKRDGTGNYEVIKGWDLANLDWKGRGYSDKNLKLFAADAEEHELLVQALKEIGIDFKNHSPIESPGANQELELKVEGIIDHEIKRALLKILMNFAAKYISCDEVLKSVWDKCRNYVRFNGEPIPTRISTKPFWGEESHDLRLEDDSYNIRIENVDNNVIAVIQFFNLYTYEFKMVENYNVPSDKEVAARFTPGKEPDFGFKKRPLS